jgi:hypothetical protein
MPREKREWEIQKGINWGKIHRRGYGEGGEERSIQSPSIMEMGMDGQSTHSKGPSKFQTDSKCPQPEIC